MSLYDFENMNESEQLAWLNDEATESELDTLHDDNGYEFTTKDGEIDSAYVEDAYTHQMSALAAQE